MHLYQSNINLKIDIPYSIILEIFKLLYIRRSWIT